MDAAFQDLMHDNLCFGCGADNAQGLQIKSHWDGDFGVCTYTPSAHQTAGPAHVLNGGIIATLIDCHSIGTAMAHAYKREKRDIGTSPTLWYVTGKMEIRYLRPTPIEAPVELRARVIEVSERRSVVVCTLSSGGETKVEGDVVAVRVPENWRAK